MILQKKLGDFILYPISFSFIFSTQTKNLYSKLKDFLFSHCHALVLLVSLCYDEKKQLPEVSIYDYAINDLIGLPEAYQ